MRIITILINVLLPLSIFAQIEIEVNHLSAFLNVDDSIKNTIKVTISNNNERSKILYLVNDSTVTGHSSKGWGWTNPLQFIGEYGNSLDLDLNDYVPAVFGTWFKILNPTQSFRIYFQSDKSIDLEKIKSMIKVRNAPSSRGAYDLDWKDDEIIIPLSPK